MQGALSPDPKKIAAVKWMELPQDMETMRSFRNKMENSTDSTGHTNCSTMLLKADTGADVNLMNKHQWSATGLNPDPKKIAAVKRMELPQDMETMRSFLGLVNYLNRFSPRLAKLSEPLRQICRQNMEFELNQTVCVAFSRTKEEISKNVTLPYFNPNSSMTLQTDASKKGLGAVLLQNSRPVMFASRALTGSERNYQNLERECLAMIWGMEKFQYFLYGKEFTLENRSEAFGLDI